MVSFSFVAPSISLIVRQVRRSRTKPGSKRTMKASWLLTGILVLGWTSRVAAEPTAHLSLTWNAPPGCPAAENVQSRVSALLGGEASASSVSDVRATGQVERTDTGFRLQLSMGVSGPPSSRVIEARSCEEIAGAAAIAIALLARSTSGSGAAAATGDTTTSSPPGEGAPNPPPAPEVPRPAPIGASQNPPESAAAPSEGLRFVIDAPIGLAGWGSLPSASLGLGVGIGLRWKALRTVVRGELWAPQNSKVSGFAAHFALQSARAEVCLLPLLHGVELGPCVGAAAQRLAGDGISSPVFSPKSQTALWASGAAGIFAAVPTPGFAPLHFFAQASVLISPIRPRFLIEQLGTVHEPGLAAPRLDLGCEWIF